MTNDTDNRSKMIVRTSVTGIIANVFLAAFKGVVGVMTHSIAIVLDAVNNISDAGSSLITIKEKGLYLPSNGTEGIAFCLCYDNTTPEYLSSKLHSP